MLPPMLENKQAAQEKWKTKSKIIMKKFKEMLKSVLTMPGAYEKNLDQILDAEKMWPKPSSCFPNQDFLNWSKNLWNYLRNICTDYKPERHFWWHCGLPILPYDLAAPKFQIACSWCSISIPNQMLDKPMTSVWKFQQLQNRISNCWSQQLYQCATLCLKRRTK